MRRNMLLVVIVLLTTVGCGSTTAEVAQAPVGAEVEKACFRVREVRGFEAVTDRFVYVHGVRGQHYLLTMANVCMGLEKSIGIAFAAGYDRVCSNDRAMITYKDFDQVKRCGILSVESVVDRDAALQLIAERTPAAGKETSTENE